MRMLRLEATEFAGAGRWRWVLTAPGGGFLADHQVDLDLSCWEFEAFADLHRYLRWHVAPDRRLEQEADVIAQVGVWAGEQVLGRVGAAMVARDPAVVRVTVPDDPLEARRLLFWPLELAHALGRPLVTQNVTLVMQPPGEEPVADVVPVGKRLRVLGLFSLPTEGRPLNLRWERQALVRMFRGIAAQGRGVEVRVLQYGVTRDRLQGVLEEAEGWDVIHISGHGAPGELALETAEGAADPDPVTAAELVELLQWAGSERVKLITVSTCWSAAMTLAEQRRLLRLPVPEDARGGSPGGDGGAAGSLAVELARRLGCAVLAMRFPVVDEFAIGLAERVYGLVADKGQPVARAVRMALSDPKVVADPPTLGCPPLSVVTPALFGGRAVDLTLEAPQRPGPVEVDRRMLRLEGFDAQPERFVGRTAVMARASGALAPRSGISGVLLHGMPGGGKTACALELAYTHEHAFQAMVWFKAPDAGRDIADALTRFAQTLEARLKGLHLVHLLEDQAELAAFLPTLTKLLELNRILIVVDNVESLLTGGGQWRDARWGPVIGALTEHGGLGRVVLTSRQVPATLDSRVKVLAVDLLSLDEALLLARELPNLAALVDGNLAGIDAWVARDLAARVLEVAQGHPKLLELADGQAADPGQLQNLLDTAGHAWQEAGGLPTGFFTTGETAAGGEDFMQVLAAWTGAAADRLTVAARTLFCFLCCLEESDRVRPVLEPNWAYLWRRLGGGGDPPSVDEGLAALSAAALAAIQPAAQQAAEEYGIHPAVADAGRSLARKEFQKAADTELADFWVGVARVAKDHEGEELPSGLVIRAGLSAAPYLLRLGHWKQAGNMLADALSRDPSRATAGAALPALRAIATALAGTKDESTAAGMVARALGRIDATEAERRTEQLLAAAIAGHDYKGAAAAASRLIQSRLAAGQLGDALQLAEDTIGYSRQAGYGPWTQLGDQANRLQILNALGQHDQVLAEVYQLWDDMATLPPTTQQEEAITPFEVREQLLDAGRLAAMQLGRQKEALGLNAGRLASMTTRGAPQTELARARFTDHGALQDLGRIDEATELLIQCREVFEDAHDIEGLGRVLGALASVEHQCGHVDVAIGLERDALRYAYLAGNMDDIQVSHHNLGIYAYSSGGQLDVAVAHHLACALLCTITGTRRAELAARDVAETLRAAADSAVPANVAELYRRVAEVPGARLDRLLARLTDPQTAEGVLEDLIARARAQAATPTPATRTARWLAAWDPVIAGAAAASQGDNEAAAAVADYLAQFRNSTDWAALATALHRVLAGDRGQGLAAELNGVSAAIVTRALDVIAGEASVPTGLWRAMSLSPLLGAVVAGAEGDDAAAERARQVLRSLAASPELADLAAALGRVLDGDQDPALASTISDDTGQAMIASVLAHLAATARGSSREGGT